MKSIDSYGEITPKVIHFKMKTQEAMIDAFMRMQERAESVNEEFRRRPFTVGEYRSWYNTHNAPVFDYPHTVIGVNFPDTVIRPFIDGDFDPLTQGEKEIVDCLRGRRGSYYLIGTFESASSAMEHEICHGLYYTDAKYKAEVTKVLATLPAKIRKKAFSVLSQSYHADVLTDELHAYMATGYADFFGDEVDFPLPIVAAMRRVKEKSFARHKINMDKLSQGKY